MNICQILVVSLLFSLYLSYCHGADTNLNNTALPTSVKPVYPYQTHGFDSDDVTSGPILIIDKKIIFISNINYDGSQHANFLVGQGMPSSKGTLVPDENKSNATLRPYIGRNIYLELPGNLTTKDIDYLALWSYEKQKSIGEVMLYVNVSEKIRESIPEKSGFHQRTKNNQTIFRVPKCCPLTQRMLPRCQPSDAQPTIQYKVLKSNETHIDANKFMENIVFIPYEYDLVCKEDNHYRYFLNESELTFALIYNSSLIYANAYGHGILSHGEFCMDNRQGPETYILMCGKDETAEVAHFPNLYVPLLIISTCCFFSSALCYAFILKAKDLHQKCFIGYASSMTITFLCLIFLQKMDFACNFIGGLFFFSIVSSVSWLTCLCTNLIFLIKFMEESPNKKRIYYYVGFSLGIPIIFLISSIAPDGIPDVPNSFVKNYSEGDACFFGDSNKYLLFIPIGLLILVSLAVICYTSFLINSRNNSREFDWLRNKSNFKFMFRSCFLILATTCIWLMEVLVNIIEMAIGLQFAIDLIEAVQGIFVLFIFVLNKYTRKKIMRVLRKGHNKDKYNGVLNSLRAETDEMHASDNGKNVREAALDNALELTEMNHDERVETLMNARGRSNDAQDGLSAR